MAPRAKPELPYPAERTPDWIFRQEKSNLVELKRVCLFRSCSKLARPLFAAAALAPLLALAGCHSPFVEATIDNAGSHTLRLVEIDYPSASFGVETIAPHAQYHYRFKILGSGSVKLSFNDDHGATHTSTGPELDEGQEGPLTVTVDDAAHVEWTPKLKSPE